MKIFEDKVYIPVRWGFCSNGRTLRSTVVGGLQGEIFKSTLRIINSQGIEIYKHYVGTRKYGMKKFGYIVRDMLRGDL